MRHASIEERPELTQLRAAAGLEVFCDLHPPVDEVQTTYMIRIKRKT